MNRIGWKIIVDGILIPPILLVISFASCLLTLCSLFCNIDDEDTNEYQPSSEERERFAKDKEEFKRKYKDQVDQVC